MAFVANTLSNLPVTSGRVIFVGGNDTLYPHNADGNAGRDPEKPMSTIDAAVARCTADRGDIIVVMPGHDENPTASITMDVAGVWIYGLGWGASRPTVTFGAATATVAMSAASCRISGIIFDLGTVAATVNDCFVVTAADCIIEDCEIQPHATSQFTTLINADATATRLIVRNNRFITLTSGAASTTGLELNGCDQVQIYGNVIMGNLPGDVIDNDTDELLDVNIFDNVFYNSSDSDGEVLDMDAAATGIIKSNHIGTNLDFEAAATGGVFMWSDNWLWDTTGKSGGIYPVRGTS